MAAIALNNFNQAAADPVTLGATLRSLKRLATRAERRMAALASRYFGTLLAA